MASRDGPRSGASSTTVREAQEALIQGEVRGYAARIARLSPIPFIGWLAFIPMDAVFAAILYPESAWVVLGIRLGVAVMLGALMAVVRRRPLSSIAEVVGLLAGLVGVLNAAIAVIATYCGGLQSIHAAGALIVMTVPSFVEQPWRRGLVPAASGLGAFVGASAITHAALGTLPDPTRDFREVVIFVGSVFLLITMGTIAVIGGHLSYRLRQQVYESRDIGRYRLKRLLGKGGMGEVWAAYHHGLKRDVALKILRDAGPRAAARFEREVQALAELRHPNTVRVFDYGVAEDGLLYFAMELLVGADLGALVKRAGPLAPERAVHLVLAASRALAEAHDKGMVHRDIKPENLFVASAGGERDFIKVLDFGIVRRGDETGETLTQEGHLAGTPAFMAPEVGRGADADPRSDVYALGAVLYFLLTGAPPFEGKGTAALLAAHQHEPIMPPSLRMEGPLASDVEEIVLACLSKSPDDRPKNAGELAERLSRTALADAWDPSLAPVVRADVAPSIAPEASSSQPSDDRETRPLKRVRGV